MSRSRLAAGFVLAMVAGFAAREPAAAQEPTAGTPSAAGQEQEDVLTREVFRYPGGEDRRDPFEPLSAGDELGPRFEDLELAGLVFAPQTGSIAILVDRATRRRYRVWEGDDIGGARLARVRPAEAEFVVTAFGVTRQETLRLKKADKERRE
ncbi:MAG: hypothetical protein RRA92_01725 [Gemmatimonadota bacterium]|nr:hypothetical protein [Gemmatimonadota bacterium]